VKQFLRQKSRSERGSQSESWMSRMVNHDEKYRAENRTLGNSTGGSMQGREVVITFNTMRCDCE